MNNLFKFKNPFSLYNAQRKPCDFIAQLSFLVFLTIFYQTLLRHGDPGIFGFMKYSGFRKTFMALSMVIVVFWIKPSFFQNSWIWILSLLTILIEFFIRGYFNSANHYFLFFYWSIALLGISLMDKSQRYHCIRLNGLLLLTGVLGISILQKIFSQSFLNGDLYTYSLYLKHIFPSFLVQMAIPDIAAYTQNFSFHSTKLINLNLHISPLPVSLKEFPDWVRWASTSMAYYVLILESLTVALFWIKKARLWKHLVLIALFIQISLITKEFLFGSMLLIFGFAMLEPSQYRLGKFYYIVILFLLISETALRIFPKI